ncbi:MAG: type II secretion system protein [Rhabdochlamydiaceae bacterium]
MRSKRKRYPITLLEIMIVILLIGVIGGVLSYNLKGTLDRGKKFRTEEGMKRLKEILDLEIDRGVITASELVGSADAPKVKTCVQRSGFISDSNLDDFLKDGWKEPYVITEHDGTLQISSYRFDQYKQSHG